MTTLVDVKKLARTHFDPEMKKRGFVRTPRSYAYFRKVNDIYHILWMENVMGAGATMRVIVTAWVPEWGLQPYDLGELPNGVGIVTGGRLSTYGPSLDHVEMQWPIATAQDAERSLVEIVADFDRLALPWLNHIQNREDLVRHIIPRFAKDRFGNRYADKACGRNLLFRDKVKPVGEK